MELLLTSKMTFCSEKSWILILIVILMVLQQSCHASRWRRAVPIFPTASAENKGNNSEAVSSEKYLKEFWNQHNGGLCPIGQVFHKNKTVCCEIAVCGPDHEIIECSSNGTADKCSRCKENYIQKHNISSLDMTDAKCYPEVNDHSFCPKGDMREARKIMHEDYFPLPCECKLEICYIENDIGSCTLKSKCPPDQQLNIIGSCEPCPWYTYKKVTGCEPCTINKTLLQQHVYITPTVRTTTLPAEEKQITSVEDQSLSTRQEVVGTQIKERDNLIPVYISLGGVVALFLGIVGLLLVCYKRRTSSGPQIPPPTPDNVPLISGGHVVLTPTRDGFGNALYLPNGQGGLHENGNNMNNIGNGHARHLCDDIEADHVHENGIADRGQRLHVGLVANGNLPNGNIPNGDQVIDVDVEQRLNESLSEQRETEMKTKESDQMNEEKTRKVDLKPASDNLYTNKDKHDLEEEYTNESLEGACGFETRKLDTIGNIEGDKGNELKDKFQRNKISIHNNKFHNCEIFIGAKETKFHQENKGKPKNSEPLTSISGSFDIDSSLSSAETVVQPGRRNENKVKERGNEDDFENEGQNAPVCRPELGSPEFVREEKNIQSRPEGRPDCVGDNDLGEMDLEHDDPVEKKPTKNVLTARSMSVPPLPQPKERPIGRVAPTVRQNSGDEVRHVSGYPSNILGEDSASSGGSASYAFLHIDENMNNGFISTGIADTNDFNDVEENGDQYSQHALQRDIEINRFVSVPYSGNMEDQRQRVRNETGSHLDAPPLTRLNDSRINATNPVPPMSQREEPEGNSITYAPVSEPYVSSHDLEQTDRKVLMNEIDRNETREKEAACVSTTAKTVVEDDDITEYKRRIKESMESGNDTDLINGGRNNDKRGKSTEESFELTSKDVDKFNVENILYQEDGTIEESSESKAMESSDKSFEINSEDIDKAASSKTASGTATYQKNNSSDSCEIDANDLKNIKKANDEVDDESCVESENRNVLETKQAVDTRENVSTCSGETSFEINSNELNYLQHSEETDITNLVDGRSEDDECVEAANTADVVSQDASMASSSDKLDMER